MNGNAMSIFNEHGIIDRNFRSKCCFDVRISCVTANICFCSERAYVPHICTHETLFLCGQNRAYWHTLIQWHPLTCTHAHIAQNSFNWIKTNHFSLASNAWTQCKMNWTKYWICQQQICFASSTTSKSSKCWRQLKNVKNHPYLGFTHQKVSETFASHRKNSLFWLSASRMWPNQRT